MKEKTSKTIVGLAGTLLLATAGWILSNTLEIKQEVTIMRKELDKVYSSDCPYCVHALHSSMSEHPLLAPTIKKAHKHLEDGTVVLLND